MLQVSSLFKDGTIGSDINIIVVSLLLLEQEPVSCVSVFVWYTLFSTVHGEHWSLRRYVYELSCEVSDNMKHGHIKITKTSKITLSAFHCFSAFDSKVFI